MSRVTKDPLTLYLESTVVGSAMVPLPADLVPSSTTGSIFDDVSDEVLLTASPTVLAHLERTASCGGLQVLGPEAVACNEVLTRVDADSYQSDLVVAGSVASGNLDWPTYDGRKLHTMWTYEPYESDRSEPSVRTTLEKEKVASGTTERGDPVLDALSTAVGLVELQRHEGVAGAADELASLYEEAWGLKAGTFAEFERCAVAPRGDLLRYALASEKDIAVANMPIQARRTISVFTGPQSRDDFGEFMSVNWNRQRVIAEAVMHMTARTEGVDMVAQARAGPPGDVSLDIRRAGILVFQPASMSVFSYRPETFRVAVHRANRTTRPRLTMPGRVQATVTRFIESAVKLGTPIGVALTSTKVETTAVATVNPSRDTIVAASMQAISAGVKGLSRGRDATKVLRGHIARCFDAALDHTEKRGFASAVVFVRDMRELFSTGLVSLSKEELTLAFVPLLSSMAQNVRASLAAEAAMRGETIESWFDEAVGTVPAKIRPVKESTSAWMTLAAWDIMSGRNGKWAGLLRHMSGKVVVESIRHATRNARVPGQFGTVARLEAYVGSVGTRNAVEWSAYYQPTARAAHEITRMFECAPRTTWAAENSKASIKLGGLLWELRSRIAATMKTKLVLEGDTEPKANEVVIRSPGTSTCTVVTVEFHKQWAAFVGSLKKPGAYQKHVVSRLATPMPLDWMSSPDGVWGTRKLPGPAPIMGTRICRYVADPPRLWKDVTKMMQQTANDSLLCHLEYEEQLRATRRPQDAATVQETGNAPGQFDTASGVGADLANASWGSVNDMMSEYTRKSDGYTILSDKGDAGLAVLESIEEDMDEEAASDFLSAVYASYDELLEAYNDHLDELEEAADGGRDAVY